MRRRQRGLKRLAKLDGKVRLNKCRGFDLVRLSRLLQYIEAVLDTCADTANMRELRGMTVEVYVSGIIWYHIR